MNFRTEQPIVDCWILPPGNLLVTAVAEGDESTLTLTVTMQGRVAGPGAALIEMVHALMLAKANLAAEKDGAR